MDLEGNSIGAAGAAAISEAIDKDDCPLQELNLSWNMLTTEGGNDISNALNVMNVYIYFMLCDMIFKIVFAPPQTNSSLRVLKLANCGFTYAPIIALCTALKNHPLIEEVDIDRPIFAKYDSDICADHLSIALQDHPSLKKLSARFHNMSDYGASLISRSLISRVNIVSLDLSW